MSTIDFQSFIMVFMRMVAGVIQMLNFKIIGPVTYLQMMLGFVVLMLLVRFLVGVAFGDRQQSSTYRRSKTK